MTERQGLRTVGAAVLAPVLLFSFATIAGLIVSLLNTAMTLLRPSIIHFFAYIVGAIIGGLGAKELCDKWLSPYNSNVVCIVIITLVVILAVSQFYALGFEWKSFNDYVFLFAVGMSGYTAFGQDLLSSTRQRSDRLR